MVVERIAEDRATWAVYHVRAEAHRQLRPHAAFFTSDRELLRAVETVTRVALDRRSILLDVEVEDLPRMLRHATPHPDRSTNTTTTSTRSYTTGTVPAIRPVSKTTSTGLTRQTRVLGVGVSAPRIPRLHLRGDPGRRAAAGRRRPHPRGSVVPDAVRDAAILRWQQDQPASTLNPGQRALVAHFVSSGKALAVGIGPPGTGKSTTMAAMRAAWETTGGRVIGFAPARRRPACSATTSGCAPTPCTA